MNNTPPGVIPLTQPVSAPQLKRFGKYILIRKLAEGGMAEIFLAKQVGEAGFERDVVVKCMLENLTNSHEFKEMFLDEARLAARLHHPNIVQITDLGLELNRYYIAMEYLSGEDLETVIHQMKVKRQPVPIGVAAKVMLAACEGLEFAHAYSENGVHVNLVHRDISPSNIFVTFQGQVKVLDFGIAKASSKLTQTQPGTLKGKWGYMSPEQARGEVLDAASDVFALGITFYELLIGRRLFEKDNEVGVLMALLQQNIDPPSKVRADIPPSLDAIVMRALEKDKSKRYRNAGEMRVALEEFCASEISMAGSSQVSGWMQKLIGADVVARKTTIPSLKQLGVANVDLLAALNTKTPTPDEDGTGKTFVRGSDPNVALPATPPPGFGPMVTPPPRPAPPVPTATHPVQQSGSGAGVVIGVLLTLLLGVGGAGAAFIVKPELFASLGIGKASAPPQPIVVAPKPLPHPQAQAPSEPTTPAVATTTGTSTASAVQPVSTTEPASATTAVAPPSPTVEDAPATTVKDPPARRLMPITGDLITRQIASRASSRIVGCAKSHLADLPADRCLVYKMSIAPNGSVASVTMLSNNVGTQFNGCFVSALRRLTFKGFRVPADGFQFTQTLNFSGKDGACPPPPKM